MPRIVTVTMNPAVDKSTVAPRVLPERKLRCSQPRREPGGGGLNVSRALRRLGQESLAVLMAGGPTGAMLESLLEREGVECRTLPTEEWTRENLMVREEGEGSHQFRFDMPGPGLSEGEWKSCLHEI
ncbi:MAG: PfkB family carbohydrate kinase, partial [Gemmatimonadota bacterium]